VNTSISQSMTDSNYSVPEEHRPRNRVLQSQLARQPRPDTEAVRMSDIDLEVPA